MTLNFTYLYYGPKNFRLTHIDTVSKFFIPYMTLQLVGTQNNKNTPDLRKFSYAMYVKKP